MLLKNNVRCIAVCATQPFYLLFRVLRYVNPRGHSTAHMHQVMHSMWITNALSDVAVYKPPKRSRNKRVSVGYAEHTYSCYAERSSVSNIRIDVLNINVCRIGTCALHMWPEPIMCVNNTCNGSENSSRLVPSINYIWYVHIEIWLLITYLNFMMVNYRSSKCSIIRCTVVLCYPKLYPDLPILLKTHIHIN